MNAFLTALMYVFAAELGDKTQIVSVAFGARYNTRTVLSAIFVSTAVMLFVWTLIGEAASDFLPKFWINLAAGALFIVFGLWALRGDGDGDGDDGGQSEEGADGAEKVSDKAIGHRERRFGPFLTVAITFFLAELGDKTLLATATIASQQHNFLAVWTGATIGMVAADAIGIFLGKAIKDKISDRALNYSSAAIFILTGVYTLVETLYLHRL